MRQCIECGSVITVADGPGRPRQVCSERCSRARQARLRRAGSGNVSAAELEELRSRARWATALRIVDGLHTAGYIEEMTEADREHARDYVVELLGEPVPGATLADMLEEAARRLRG